MTRRGLFIALSVAGVAALLFGIWPQLDLKLARLFYSEETHRFVLGPVGLAEFVRRAAMCIAWALAAPALIAPIVKLIRPGKPLIVPGRAVVFLVTTVLVTAAVLPSM